MVTEPTMCGAPGYGLWTIATTAALAAALFWLLDALIAPGSDDLFASPPARKPARDDADPALAARLDALMRAERAYRDPGLTIAALAARLSAPEYRLRRHINGALGHRNFSAYLNGLRLAEVKAALADPAQAQTPVLTIALDSGFGSLAAFNRAFKDATGQTPTEFRRAAAGKV